MVTNNNSLTVYYKDLGLNLVSVLDYLRIKQVVGLGDGAGANIITRFGMCHPSRVYGIFTINNSAGVSMGRFMEGLKVGLRIFMSLCSLFTWLSGEDEGSKRC